MPAVITRAILLLNKKNSLIEKREHFGFIITDLFSLFYFIKFKLLYESASDKSELFVDLFLCPIGVKLDIDGAGKVLE